MSTSWADRKRRRPVRRLRGAAFVKGTGNAAPLLFPGETAGRSWSESVAPPGSAAPLPPAFKELLKMAAQSLAMSQAHLNQRYLHVVSAGQITVCRTTLVLPHIGHPDTGERVSGSPIHSVTEPISVPTPQSPTPELSERWFKKSFFVSSFDLDHPTLTF